MEFLEEGYTGAIRFWSKTINSEKAETHARQAAAQSLVKLYREIAEEAALRAKEYVWDLAYPADGTPWE